jgi:hypothetical protein
VTAARHRLADRGISREQLLRFPAEQVLLLGEKDELEVRQDENLKLINLPPWQVEAITAGDTASKPRGLFDAILSAPAHNMARSQGRLDQRFALLRHVEALRLHAAAYSGAVPAKLSEIALPLPDDPSRASRFGTSATATRPICGELRLTGSITTPLSTCTSR